MSIRFILVIFEQQEARLPAQADSGHDDDQPPERN
jgi:hypothetical protein